jgi:hypothetical protein
MAVQIEASRAALTPLSNQDQCTEKESRILRGQCCPSGMHGLTLGQRGGSHGIKGVHFTATR